MNFMFFSSLYSDPYVKNFVFLQEKNSFFITRPMKNFNFSCAKNGVFSNDSECIKLLAAIQLFKMEWGKDAVFDVKLETSLDFYKEAVQRTNEVLDSFLGPETE